MIFFSLGLIHNMRQIMLIRTMLLYCAFSAIAADDVSSKTEEMTFPDNKHIQNVTFYRDGKRILIRTIIKDKTGKPITIQESFFF